MKAMSRQARLHRLGRSLVILALSLFSLGFLAYRDLLPEELSYDLYAYPAMGSLFLVMGAFAYLSRTHTS